MQVAIFDRPIAFAEYNSCDLMLFQFFLNSLFSQNCSTLRFFSRLQVMFQNVYLKIHFERKYVSFYWIQCIPLQLKQPTKPFYQKQSAERKTIILVKVHTYLKCSADSKIIINYVIKKHPLETTLTNDRVDILCP